MSKYLFVTPNLYTGGAERVISVLSSALVKLGQEVCILKYFNGDVEFPIDERVKTISFVADADEYRKTGRIKRVLFIKKVVKDERPDFVVPLLFHVALAVSVAEAGTGVNVIQSIRNNPFVSPSKKHERWIRDRMVARAKCSFVQNESQRLYFAEKTRDKLYVLFNPVADEFFEVQRRFPDGRFVFCAVGRLVEQKNFELLIRSFTKAFDGNQGVTLVIYGDGYLKERLQGLVESEGCSSRIYLPGRATDMAGVYAAADAFVMSSNFEGMPNALMEAMASGVPSISTDCPTGPSDLIEHGKDGLLVPTNDVDALARAMAHVYADSELRRRLSALGREKIRKLCSAESIARQMMQICESSR